MFEPDAKTNEDSTAKSTSSKESTTSLRRIALEAYGNGPHVEVLQCPILLASLPAHCVACAHLVPQSLRNRWIEFGIEVETRNVLFLFKSIEEAYDKYFLSFVWTDKVDESGRNLFRVHVWDPQLMSLPVIMNVRSRTKQRYPFLQLPAEVASMTFGQLHNQLRVLATRNHAPYNRALAFQAILARAKARKRDWPDLDLPEMVSPTLSEEKKLYIAQWRDAAASVRADGAGGLPPTEANLDAAGRF